MKRELENTLKNIRGRWWENGKWLTTNDLSFVSCSYARGYVLSKVTGQLYYQSQIIYL